MTLMLDSLVFEVNTDQLADAYSKVGMLADAVERLNAPLTELTKSSEKVSKKLKEQRAELSGAADEINNLGKESESSAPKLDKITQVITKQIESMKILRNESINTSDSTDKLGEGFTKSQAGQLAYIKMLGATGDQLKTLASSFKEFNEISGANPFDKSTAGLFKMTKELQELEIVSKLSAEGLNLTRGQVVELSRDLVRLTQALQSAGASEQEIAIETAKLKAAFSEKAATLNAYIQKSKEAEKAAIDKAKAEADVEKSLQELRSRTWMQWRNGVDQEIRDREELRKSYVSFYEEQDRLDKQRVQQERANFDNYVNIQRLKKKEAEETSKAILADMRKMYLADEKASGVSGGSDAAKKTRELAAANKYLADTEQRLHEALAETNSDLKLRFSDQLAKIKRNLEIVGEGTDETSAKFKHLSDMIHKVAAKERVNDINNLGRAMSVQLGDIAVSLASGMNPMMVMIQQGDQIRDAISRSRVEGKQLEKAMATAASVIATSFINTGKVIGSFVSGAARSSGEAFTGMLVSMRGIEASNAFSKKVKEIHEMEDAGLQLNGTLALTKNIISAIGLSSIALIALLASTGVAMYSLAKSGDAVTKALALTGANMGLTKDQAIAMSSAIASATGSTLVKAEETLGLIASTSNLTGKAIELAATSAIELEKVAGVSIDKTIAQFEKMRDKPVEALTELARTVGNVSSATLKQVIDLEKAGKSADASRVAIEALAESNSKAANNIKNSLSPLGLLFIQVKQDVDLFKQSIYELANSSVIVDVLKSTWQGLAKAIYDVGYSAKRTKIALDITMSNAEANAQLQELAAARLVYFRSMEEGQTKVNGLTAQEIALQAKAVGITADANAEYMKSATVETKIAHEKLVLQGKITEAMKTYKSLVKQAFVSGSNESAQALADEAGAMLVAVENYKKALAELDKKKKETSGGAKLENFAESAINQMTGLLDKAVGKADELTKAQIKYLDLSQRPEWKLLPDSVQQQVVAIMALADAQERLNLETAETTKFEQMLGKITGKVEEFSAEYNAMADSISKQFQKGYFGDPMSQEALDSYTKYLTLLNSIQPAAKANTEAVKKYNEEIIKGNDKLDLELEQLRLKNSLIGLSADDQKLLNIEYQKMLDMQKVSVEYANRKRQIETDTKISDEVTRQKLLKDLDAERLKAMSVVAMRYNTEIAEHYRAEYDRVALGLTDSIVTALIEGGKAGSQKIRDLIIAELKKPITVVIKALVDGTLGKLFSQDKLTSGMSFVESVNKSISDSYSAIFNKIAKSDIGEKLGLSKKVEMGPPAPDGSMGMTKEITQMGQMIKNGLSMVSSAITGYQIQKGISNGYQIGNGKAMNAITSIGAAIASAFLGPIGGIIVGAIGGLVNRMFGRKLKDTGFEGTFGGTSGFSGRAYEFYKGGWFSSDKTKYKELDDEFASGMASAFQQSQSALAVYAESIGLTSDAILNYTKQVKVSLKGLTEEQAQKKLEEELSLMQDEMAKLALGTDFVKKSTETYSEALTRLSTNLSGVNALFDNLNYVMLDTSLAGASLASSIVDAFGSMETMTTKIQSYYENYYTANEKSVIVTRQVTAAFTKLGFSMPKTRDEFRALVESQDLATESGRNTYATLISLSDAFASLTQSTDEIIKALEETVAASKETAQTQIDGAVKYLESVIDTSKDTEKVWSDLSKDISKYLNSLSNSIGADSILQKREAAKKEFDEIVKEIRSGNTANANSLTGLSNDYLSAVADTASTSEEYVRAVSGVRSELEMLVGYSNAQIEAEKLKQEQAQKTIDALTKLNEYLSTDSLTKEGIADFIKQLNDIKLNLDPIKIIEDSKLLDQWLNPLIGTMDNLSKEFIKLQEEGLKVVVTDVIKVVSDIVKPPVKVDNGLTQEDKDIENIQRAKDAYWLDYQKWMANSENTDAPIWQDYLDKYDIDQFANGGFHMGGLRLVGENGPELEATGPSRIWTASQTSGMLSGNNSTISEELLREVLEELKINRENMKSAMYQIAKNTQKTSDQLSRWDGDGMPETRT